MGLQLYVVEVFFQLAYKWSKWCAQTLHPFSQILKIFSGISARIVALHKDDFQICSLCWKGLSSRKKTLQTATLIVIY